MQSIPCSTCWQALSLGRLLAAPAARQVERQSSHTRFLTASLFGLATSAAWRHAAECKQRGGKPRGLASGPKRWIEVAVSIVWVHEMPT